MRMDPALPLTDIMPDKGHQQVQSSSARFVRKINSNNVACTILYSRKRDGGMHLSPSSTPHLINVTPSYTASTTEQRTSTHNKYKTTTHILLILFRSATTRRCPLHSPTMFIYTAVAQTQKLWQPFMQAVMHSPSYDRDLLQNPYVTRGAAAKL